VLGDGAGVQKYPSTVCDGQRHFLFISQAAVLLARLLKIKLLVLYRKHPCGKPVLKWLAALGTSSEAVVMGTCVLLILRRPDQVA
jgi:hypothetical protein